MGRLTIDDSEVRALFKDLNGMPDVVMKQAFPYYKSKTPVRSGNARNQTKRNRTTINSNYAYAGRLDEGWSKQSPDGFTEPTSDKMEDYVDNYIKRVS